MKKINIYFKKPPLGYKWIPGDRHILHFVKQIFKGKKVSGLDKVFINLCKGFDELKIEYVKNLPFNKIKPLEPVVVLGIGKHGLQGYVQNNPIIAGIGLMTHPVEWLNLFNEYPVVKYLQHSQWASEIYKPYYGKSSCDIWPCGIDTVKWSPNLKTIKQLDFLIYNKIMWNKEQTDINLRLPLLKKLNQSGFTYCEIIYGRYTEAAYLKLLLECKAMVFLCEHESQGFACCEALSTDVPVFAWDQGQWLDPNRFVWNDPVVPATSVPYFDNRCGMTFKDFDDFEKKIGTFWQQVKKNDLKPREYVLENLTLKKSAQKMLDIINSVYN